MAVAVAARDKQHARGGNAGHEKRIVIRAAHEFLKSEVVLAAGANERVDDGGRTDCRRVGIYNLKLEGDATFLRHSARFVLDSLEHFIAPGEVSVSKV